MNHSEDENDVPEIHLLGKTYLATNDSFYIRNDPFVCMAAGDRHSIVVTESGRAFAFGDNNSGQLGLGHTDNVNKVSCIRSLKFADTDEKIQLVACGRESSIVATNYGSLYSFGSNSHGQLGFESDDSTVIHPSPVKIDYTHLKIAWKQICMGAEHTCALTDDGIVYTWGSNEDGQCGHVLKYDHITRPKEIRLDYVVSTISCGYYHTALIDEDGQLFLFGNNDDRQLGHSTTDTSTNPLKVSLPEPVKKVACGNQHTIVLTESGKIYICGLGDRGQLGLGSRILSTDYFESIERNLPLEATAVAAGEGHSAIIGSHGDLYVFGDGKHSKLDYQTHRNKFEPHSIEFFKDHNVLNVVCGGCQTLILAQKRSSITEDDIENIKELQLEPLKSPAHTQSSMDMYLQHDEPDNISDQAKNSLSRVESNTDSGFISDELSASTSSKLMNTTHIEKDGILQPIHFNDTQNSKMFKTGILDHSVPLINATDESTERSQYHSKSVKFSSPEKISDDENTQTTVHSSSMKTSEKYISQRISSEKNLNYDDDDEKSDSSTTVSRSSSASSDDENATVPSGTIDDLHQSFPPPQRLKADNAPSISIATENTELGLFSRLSQTNTSQTKSINGNKNSKACIIL